MYMKISDELVERLGKYKDSRILLDLDDGVGMYSKMGSCALNISFRLLILDKDQDYSDYTVNVESPIGKFQSKNIQNCTWKTTCPWFLIHGCL